MADYGKQMDPMVAKTTNVLNDLFTKVIENTFEKMKCDLLEELQNKFASQIANLEKDVDLLQKENVDLKATVKMLETKYKTQASDIGLLSSQLTTAQRYCIESKQDQRRNNIVVRGLQIPTTTTCLDEVTSFIESKLNTHLDKGDIIDVQVLHLQSNQQKISPIIIRFKSHVHKMRVISKRRSLKSSGVHLQDDMCPENQEMISDLRSNESIGNVWSWDGKIYIK